MTTVSNNELAQSGLWHRRPELVQVLACSPLLAASNSVVNALVLGIATLLVLTGASLGMALVRLQLPAVTRLLVLVILTAAFTTCVELVMQAFAYQLYQALGMFLPLLACNCLLLIRADADTDQRPLLSALFEVLKLGLGFTLLLTALGAIREVIGTGSVFATLAPGAFLVLGLMVALANVANKFLTPTKAATVNEPPPPGSKRVRVTGKI